jgi:hypothetical protein
LVYMDLLVTKNCLGTAGDLGCNLIMASPTAWPLPSGWFVTSALTISIGRVVTFTVCRFTCRECSAVVALEESCRSCCASGEVAPGVADAPDVPDDDVAAEDPAAPDVWELPVEDLLPQPVMTVATSAAANRIATAGVEGRREIRRCEICACVIKPFMASLCCVIQPVEMSSGSLPSS